MPDGVNPDAPVLVTAAVKMSDCPAITLRVSGTLELSATSTPFKLPSAKRVPPLSV